MICPECKVQFRGGAYSYKGESWMHRRCPNGHEFKEPPKKRNGDTWASLRAAKDSLKKIQGLVIACDELEIGSVYELPADQWEEIRDAILDSMSDDEKNQLRV